LIESQVTVYTPGELAGEIYKPSGKQGQQKTPVCVNGSFQWI